MSIQIDVLLASIDGEIAKVAAEAALEIERELKAATPVDTGNARAHWEAQLNGVAITSPADAAGAGPSAEIAVANAIDYIDYLARGSSPQAAEGWVEEAATRGAATVGAIVQTRELKL